MSAVPHEPFGPDDWMAIADAVGVTAPAHPELLCNWRAEPAHRHEFTDPALAAVLANWTRAAAGIEVQPEDLGEQAVDPDSPIGYWPADCGTCADTGLITVISRGAMFTVECYSCRGRGC